jgi:hypothetical protein
LKSTNFLISITFPVTVRLPLTSIFNPFTTSAESLLKTALNTGSFVDGGFLGFVGVSGNNLKSASILAIA